MDANNFISVISVNYNGYYDTCNFIDSWTTVISSFRYEIIIIDNGSEMDESILIKNRYLILLLIEVKRILVSQVQIILELN